MEIAVYPGSFDPITNGHLDILHRATKLFDKVIIAVLKNPVKQPLLDESKRIELIKSATKDMEKVEVDSFHGLTVAYAHNRKAKVIIRGLRALSDFERELQMSQANKDLNKEVETVFLMCSLQYAYLSSSMVKEISFLGGDVTDLVPIEVNKYLSIIREKRFKDEYK